MRKYFAGAGCVIAGDGCAMLQYEDLYIVCGHITKCEETYMAFRALVEP
jgi:hypothetical protein